MKRGLDLRRVARAFAIELIIYGTLLVAYFLLVLRLLGTPLIRLFKNNLVLYGIAALVLIVSQGVLLDAVTTFLVKRLGLDRLV